jgi:hypothetical protein
MELLTSNRGKLECWSRLPPDWAPQRDGNPYILAHSYRFISNCACNRLPMTKSTVVITIWNWYKSQCKPLTLNHRIGTRWEIPISMVSLVQHLLLGDGFTKTLTAEGLVQPGVNHIKLAIADQTTRWAEELINAISLPIWEWRHEFTATNSAFVCWNHA